MVVSRREHGIYDLSRSVLITLRSDKPIPVLNREHSMGTWPQTILQTHGSQLLCNWMLVMEKSGEMRSLCCEYIPHHIWKKFKVILYWWQVHNVSLRREEQHGTGWPTKASDWQGLMTKGCHLWAVVHAILRKRIQQHSALWFLRDFSRKYSLISLEPLQTKIYTFKHHSHPGRINRSNQGCCMYQSTLWIPYLVFLKSWWHVCFIAQQKQRLQSEASVTKLKNK